MATLIIAVNQDVMHHPKLKLLDKLILSYVLNWESKGKSCYAKDGFFAGLFGVAEQDIRYSLFKLEALNLINCLSGIGGRLIRSERTEKTLDPVQEKDIFEL
jgi:hypothetical protein